MKRLSKSLIAVLLILSISTMFGSCAIGPISALLEKFGRKHEHTEGKWIIDFVATCTSSGVRHKECTECGKLITIEEMPAIGHNKSDWKVGYVVACCADGLNYIECTVCRETLETEVVPALGHDYLNGICTRCGDVPEE